MASPSNLLKLVVVIFSLVLSLRTLSASKAGGDTWKKIELGSKPPQCNGKCSNCRPCMAALVVPKHHERKGFEEEDDSYYLLHWECKCGNKVYHP